MEIAGAGAIVTGGASGMGRETAWRLAAAGARVALLDIDAAAARRVAEQIGGRAYQCDVADPLGTRRALDQACVAVEPVRILVTCAGIGRTEPIVCSDNDAAYARMAETIHVNLLGTLNVIRVTVGVMIRQALLADGARGVVTMVASSAAHEGPAGAAPYAASKGGIVSMTLPLARELAEHGIRVNTISPGAFATPALQNVPRPLLEQLARSTPFPKRPGSAAEFADLVLHLCTNDFLNGAVIRLDGGNRVPYYPSAR